MTRGSSFIGSMGETLSTSVGTLKESKKMLVAAMIEWWITQLMSELNYNELLIFFLTYRTYISPIGPTLGP